MKDNQNDSKILDLKNIIKEKKSKLTNKKKFFPLTNCNLGLDGIRYNLHSLTTKESLIQLLIKLNVFKQSAVELKLLGECNFSGYNVLDWMSDVQLKLEILSFSEEERKLKTLEQKLDDLLSNEKKIELELDSIQDLIKNS